MENNIGKVSPDNETSGTEVATRNWPTAEEFRRARAEGQKRRAKNPSHLRHAVGSTGKVIRIND